MRVESVRWLSRAALAMIAAALSLCPSALHPAFAADAKLQGLQIVFVEPYGPHSVTSIPVTLMRSACGLRIDRSNVPPPRSYTANMPSDALSSP